MIYHANRSWLSGGFLGVEVFFVISGYLITLLLIAEEERKGHVDLKQFWIRRARRLLPALFVMLLGVAVYTALFYNRARASVRGDLIASLFYGSNWFQIWVGAGYTAGEAFAPLRHLWSLAVEEQFYLLWPLIMVLILRLGLRRLPKVGLWLIAASVVIAVVTALLYQPGDVAVTCAQNMNGYARISGRCISINDALYLTTFTRAGGIVAGAGFAMLWRPNAIIRGPLRHKAPMLDGIAVAGAVLLGFLFWHTHVVQSGTNFGSRFDPWLFRGGLFLTGVATLMMIAAVTHRRVVDRPHPRHPRPQLDRHPELRPVPVPLADLPDDPQAGRRAVDAAQVRAGDGDHAADHRGQLSLHRDARAQGPAQGVVAPAALARGVAAAGADRRRGDRVPARHGGGEHRRRPDAVRHDARVPARRRRRAVEHHHGSTGDDDPTGGDHPAGRGDDDDAAGDDHDDDDPPRRSPTGGLRRVGDARRPGRAGGQPA